MYRFYKTDLDYLDGKKIPCPEPNNWIGYSIENKFILKTNEELDAKELTREDIKKEPIECWKIFDQFL